MSEILDDSVEFIPNKNGFKFTLLSFINGVGLIALFYYFTTTFRFSQGQGYLAPSIYAIYLLFALLVSGFVFIYFSFRSNEKLTLLKWIGALLNVLSLLITVASIIYTNLFSP